MTYVVIGLGTHSKSPAYFADYPQAESFARGFARAGIASSVYKEVAAFSPEQFKEDQ